MNADVTARFATSNSRIVQFFAVGMVCSAVTPACRVEAQQTLPFTNNISVAQVTFQPASESIWEHGVGEGFRSSTQSLGVSAGANYGVAILGGKEAHHLALLGLSYGHMLGAVKGERHWYRGNFEGRLELFGGMQFHPPVDTDGWLIGLTPHLRYDFATGTRWIPFFDAGAGVTATGIGPPDLSGTFEFNLRAATGIHWFLKDKVALTAEAGYLHMSCARIHTPNLGLNGVTGMLGLSFFF